MPVTMHQLLSGTTVWTLPAEWQGPATICIVVLRGTCQVTAGVEQWALTECTFLVVPPIPPPSIEINGHVLAVYVPESFEMSKGAGTIHEVPPLEAALLMDVFIDNHRSQRHQQSAVDLLCYQFSGSTSTPTAQPTPESLTDAIIHYLSEHIDMPLTLEELVLEFSYSKSHIFKQFQDQVGASPMLVLARLRIKRAKQLLADTDLTISQVGHNVSYPTVSSFSHFFKKHTGMSPRDYRENIQWLV